ncbi:MAG: class I SAM-dependent methyltransferase [Candidatus Eisenbacteria bacterium]
MARLIERLAEDPRAFTWLRKVAEANFTAVRRAAAAELPLEQPARVLDLGCGTGEIAPFFAGQRYLGIDVSPRYLAYARRRFPRLAFCASDGSRLPLRDASFDWVWIFGVLHHMPDDLARAVLTEAARVLAGGGRLLLIEDSREVPGWNVPGRIVHALDAGENIRRQEEYESLLPAGAFDLAKRFSFTSGICVYHAFHLIRKSG